jgi:hypothetical protein
MCDYGLQCCMIILLYLKIRSPAGFTDHSINNLFDSYIWGGGYQMD